MSHCALTENNMVSVSVQDFYETVTENLPYYIGLNAATGGKWLCVSRFRVDSHHAISAFGMVYSTFI